MAADLEISVDINASGTKKGAAEARSAVKSIADESETMAKRLKSAGSALTSIGQTMSIAVTAPIAAAGVAMLKAGAEYEQALNIFQAVTHATGDEMLRAQQVAKDLGADLTLPATSAKDAALAMNELGKAGLTAAQSMDAAKGVLQLAAAGQLDGARAAEIAANALNAFKLEAKETTRIADLLAAAANASSSSVDDVALSMQQASAVFAAAKIPIEDMTTAIGIMANAGIKGSDAGTSLKQFLLSLEAPTSKAAKVMQDLGVQVFDTTGRMKDLPVIIGDFEKALAPLTDQQKSKALAQIFGSDAIRAAQILFSTGAEGFAQMKQAVTAQGAAAELANAQMKGLSGAWAGLKSQLETIGITIYDSIKQPLTEAVQALAQFAGNAGDAFANLSPGVQQAVVAFAAFLAAIGPVVYIVGQLLSLLGFLVGSAGPLALLAAGLAQIAVVAGVVYAAWQTNFGGIRDLTQTVADAMKTAWDASLNAIRDLTRDVTAEVKKFWDENGQDIIQLLQTMSQQIKDIWTGVVQFWRDNNEQIKAIAAAVWDVIKTLVVGAVRGIADVIKLTMALINGDWAKAWDAMKDLVKLSGEAILGILRGLKDAMVAVVRLAFQAIWDLGSWVTQQAIQLGVNIVQGMANGITNSAHLAIDAAKRLAASLPDWVKKVLNIQSPSKVFHQIGVFIAQGLAQGISDGTGGAVASGQSMAKRVLAGILSIFRGGSGSGSYGGGSYGTPPFQGGGSGGGLTLGGMLGQIFNGNGGPRDGSITENSDGQTVFNVNPGNAGIWNNLKNLFSTKEGGIFAPRQNILTGKDSKWGGILGGAGSLMSMVAGFFGPNSRFGTVLGSVGKGLEIGSMFGPIGAGVGAAIGLITGIFGLNKKRRQEETARNQAMLDSFDALKQLDTIIADVRSLRVDPASGIAQATSIGAQVRSQYLQFANSLTDKKTRNIAIKDVSRIDTIIAQKMEQLRAVADVATAAGERARRLIPEFAGGVYMSPSFRRMNGMLGGTWTGRDYIPALLADREMILNPRQQQRVIANAGRDVFADAGIPGYAGGGVASVPAAAPSEPTTIVLNFEHYIDAEGMVHTQLAESPKVQKELNVVINDMFRNDQVKTKRR